MFADEAEVRKMMDCSTKDSFIPASKQFPCPDGWSKGSDGRCRRSSAPLRASAPVTAKKHNGVSGKTANRPLYAKISS